MRYVLHPGFVFSKNDDDRHFIDARTLARLYDVPLKDCVVIDQSQRGYRQHPEDVHLRPDYSGNYELPQEPHHE